MLMSSPALMPAGQRENEPGWNTESRKINGGRERKGKGEELLSDREQKRQLGDKVGENMGEVEQEGAYVIHSLHHQGEH